MYIKVSSVCDEYCGVCVTADGIADAPSTDACHNNCGGYIFFVINIRYHLLLVTSD